MMTMHDSTTDSALDPLISAPIQDDDLVKITVSGKYYKALQHVALVLNRELTQNGDPDTPQTLLRNFILTSDIDNEFACIVDGLDYTAYIKPTDNKAEIEAQEEEIKNRLYSAWGEAK